MPSGYFSSVRWSLFLQLASDVERGMVLPQAGYCLGVKPNELVKKEVRAVTCSPRPVGFSTQASCWGAPEREEHLDLPPQRIEVLLRERVADIAHVRHSQPAEGGQVQSIRVGVSNSHRAFIGHG